VVHAGPNIGNDLGDLRTAVGQALADHEYPDRFIELAYAFYRRAELQFGIERDLEKAVLDLIIGKIRSLGGAPAADVGILRIRRTATDPGKRYRDRGEGHYDRFADDARPSRGSSRRKRQGAGYRQRNQHILQPAKNHTAFPAREAAVSGGVTAVASSKLHLAKFTPSAASGEFCSADPRGTA
jgi:hypothetical protein